MDIRVKQLVKFMTEQKEKASKKKEIEASRNFTHSSSYWHGAEMAFSDAIKEVSKIFEV